MSCLTRNLAWQLRFQVRLRRAELVAWKTGRSMIEEIWNSMMTTRGRTLTIASGISQRQSQFAPASGGWSVGEVLDHLILADRFYRNEIAALIELAEKNESPVLTRSLKEIDVGLAIAPRGVLEMLEIPMSVMNMFIPKAARNFLTRNRILAATNPSGAAPQKARPISTLREELAASLNSLHELLDSNAHLEFSRMIHRHPVMGVNNVPSLLRMAELHERRHQEQMRNILEEPGFPAG